MTRMPLLHLEYAWLGRAGHWVITARAFNSGFTALPSQAKRILDAKEACKSFGLDPLNAITTYRNVYDDADEDGYSVLEIETDPRAVEEIRAIGHEFLEV